MPVAGDTGDRPAPAGPAAPGGPRNDAVRASTSSRASTTAAPRTPWSITERRRGLPLRRHGPDPALGSAAPGTRRRDLGLDVERTATTCGGTGPCARARAAAWCWSRWGAAQRRLPRRRAAAAVRRHRRVLAELAAPVDLPRPLAGDGRPLGHDAQADDLRADRRAGRRAHRRAARAGRRRAQLGLPLHLDPGRARSRSTRCSASATWRRRPPSASGSGTGSSERQRRAAPAR